MKRFQNEGTITLSKYITFLRVRQLKNLRKKNFSFLHKNPPFLLHILLLFRAFGLPLDGGGNLWYADLVSKETERSIFMRKYIRFAALTLALAVFLCACSSGRVGGTVTATTPTEAAQENPVSLGKMEGGVYENSYTGYGCKLDGNWEFYTAEELQELPANTREILGDSELMEKSADLEMISDMQAENLTDFTSIGVLYTKLDLQTRLTYAAMGEKAILEATLEQEGQAIKDSYAQAGIAVEEISLVEVTFAGQTRTAMKTVGTAYELPYYILQIMDFRLGAYSVTLTLSSFQEDRTEDMLSLFYALD